MSVLASPQYVSAGDQMTYTGQFGSFLFSAGPDALVAAVKTYLANNYQLSVLKEQNNISYSGLGNGSITLWLQTNIDRGDGETDDGLTDIQGNCDQAFTSCGQAPSASSITSYTPAPTANAAGAPVAQATITPNTPQVTVPNQPTPPAGQSFWDRLGLGGLGTSLGIGTIGLAVGGLLVAGVVIFVLVRK